MVPQIENVSPEMEIVSFHQREPLRYRKVPVLLVRSPKCVAGNVSVAGGSSGPIGDDGSRADKVRIDVVIESALNRARKQ
jgi:hypothetical protein